MVIDGVDRKETAFIGIGSNVGDKEANCRKAIELLGLRCIKINRLSSFYVTSPVGYAKQPDFVNAVAEVDSYLSPNALYKAMVDIEKAMGKNKPFKNGPRIIDMDLLIYGNMISLDKDLILPHPRMHLRRFVLEPLSEIAPTLVHPVLNKTVKTLLASVKNGSERIHLL